MQKCPTCSSETSQATPFCPYCGKPFPDAPTAMISGDVPTVPPRAATPPRSPISSHPSTHTSRAQGRFVPGMMISGRYRVINLLGKGGMGEVYRADDLRLAQEVALKFLPEAATDEDTLERFRSEVRIARRISHPNVCRVYDIGEAEHSIFLSMEYIDGEDLGSLLRRIGRLSPDKALEIGRKICAGLGAAHAQGVLHRDLKPANVMLNGQGEVLIMDFGLAGVAHEISDIRSGTPAYMAPEQLSGKEVTVKSDIYSLGLLLYELFTGKRAFEGKTYDEIMRARTDTPPSRPSSIVKDLDPVVERAILRCLEPDPALRPPTALAVAAALPGGDPLAAALAAGETPSPQLVAAAGANIGLRVGSALTWLGLALAGLIAFYALGIRTSAVNMANTPYSPEVLSQKARDAAQQLGYPQPVDSASWMNFDNDMLQYSNDHHLDWKQVLGKGRPPLLLFKRRESPGTLVAIEPKDTSLLPGIVNSEDPAPIKSGMVSVTLDAQGRLWRFDAIPPERDTPAAPTEAFDWNVLFKLAGLDQAQFKPAQPEWNSLGSADSRVAWTGVWPGTSYPVRVEAGAYKGRPVHFALISDWTRAHRTVDTGSSRGKRIAVFVSALLGTGLLIGALLITARNYKFGKSDTEGAYRLGIFVFGMQMLLWLFRTHFVTSIGLTALFMLALSASLFVTVVVCLVYLAVEPYIRRHWPQAIISWSRLMSGRFRDPHVGRDLLYGVLLGLTWGVLFQTGFLLMMRSGQQPQTPDTNMLMGLGNTVGMSIWHLSTSVQGALEFFFLMFVLRVIARKPWLAAIAFVALLTAMKSVDNESLMLAIPLNAAIYGIAAFFVLRFGFITLATGLFVADLILNVPLTTSMSNWYFGDMVFVLGVVGAIAAWGCYTSLGGQKILGERLLE